jgi:hypothetical protein
VDVGDADHDSQSDVDISEDEELIEYDEPDYDYGNLYIVRDKHRMKCYRHVRFKF